MPKSSARSVIRLRGVRQNNLKNFDLDLPLNRLIVITGLSGSGKSSLAFDTLFAEGQRRYIETFSPYARQFFDRMDRPRVDSIEGIPPAIAIEQRNAVRTTRSTVGTMTEVCDYMKPLWPHLAQLHCRQCGEIVRQEPPHQVWQSVQASLDRGRASKDPPPELLVTFNLPLSDKLELDESLALVSKQGYQRLLVGSEIVRLDEFHSRVTRRPAFLTVVQDRVRPVPKQRARFIEACEQAYHFGKGKLTVWEVSPTGAAGNAGPFSNRRHCAKCDLEYRDPSPALFSFNNPVGACPACRGFGRIITIDYERAMPDRTKTLAEGVVRPWQSGVSADCQRDLLRTCRHFEIPTDVPFDRLAEKWQKLVIDGDPDYGKDEEHEWPRAWYGVKGYFRWLESKAYKMHVRVLLSRYRAYTTCPECEGKRFQPEALLYRVPLELVRDASGSGGQGRSDGAGLTLADFYQLPIRDAAQALEGLAAVRGAKPGDPLAIALGEVRSRLRYLQDVGLGYLTLDRPTRSLSGGETERVNLTTCLGTGLVNTLFVLDEPSVGLHARDTQRLTRILEKLRDAGNTVVVVEHEASLMRAADQIVDLGPGHGATGGQVVFQGPYEAILKEPSSITGQYLSGRKQIEPAFSRRASLKTAHNSSSYRSAAIGLDELALHDRYAPIGPRSSPEEALRLSHATRHNLRDLSVVIPLQRLVCITGVSGSGKSTLVREVLLPALEDRFRGQSGGAGSVEESQSNAAQDDGSAEETEAPGRGPRSVALAGGDSLGGVVLVDQSSLGKTPRSNPAVYIGAFDELREFFAQTAQAKKRGLDASAFSFNSRRGQCERCRGAGFEKIEMQFLSDVFIRCADCDGRRYRPHILEVKVSAGQPGAGSPGGGQRKPGERPNGGACRAFSIADLLEATVEEAIEFLSTFPESRPARRAIAGLGLLAEVGLGYLQLGQPINTLSGGESQRLKLVRHLADSQTARARGASSEAARPLLFLFDEPTTGLHFDDIRVLLQVFQRLVQGGHSVIIIEHNLDVIRCAEWVIDLGPEAGDEGGQIVAEGPPEEIAANPHSHTGRALRDVLSPVAARRGRGRELVSRTKL